MSDIVPLGPSQPGANLAAMMWQAMRGAASSMSARREPSHVAASDEDIAERLPVLWNAVWRAAGGHDPALVAPPPRSRELLDAVRRSFLDLVRSTPQICLEV